ncbi:hypothetical protein [uncultured Anaerococcus sp.]|uniref:hypothetical protein n=1 Tax=uncultured Anaerococcus sp. TaxID=293428 RepID=UPI002605F895|nr:hypothetical protein [uncultured Anaerococcus sp.]
MNFNLEKQLLNDFSTDRKSLYNDTNDFVVNQSDLGFLTYNNNKLAINILPNKVLFRSDNEKLIELLENEYKDYPAPWFFEFANILKLQHILNSFDISIKNMGPIYVTNDNFQKLKNDYILNRIDKKDFYKFKGISHMCFSFDDGYYEDMDALAYYDKYKLVGLTGINVNSKYLWEFGVEKFSYEKKYKDIMPILVNNLAYIVMNENPNITPIYATQFSHIKSINLANKAGFKLAMSFINAD